MFTGIIEKLGKVAKVEKNGGNLELFVASDLASELKVDQSVAHNGICLTVVEIFGDKGKHARAAVGIGSLPYNIAVEIEMIVEIEE